MKLNQVSPLTYVGGKTRAIKKFENIIDFKKYNFKCIYSGFFGGGSYEIYLSKKYKVPIIANDINEHTYNFWKNIVQNKKELIRHITSILEKYNTMSAELFKLLKSEIMVVSDYSVYKSALFYILNKFSFSGKTFTVPSKTKILKYSLSNFLKFINEFEISNLKIENRSYTLDILKYNNDDTFIYLDPPYYNLQNNGWNLMKKRSYYVNHNNFDHLELYNTLKNINKFVLSYNNCEYIINLYKDLPNTRIVELDWSYGTDFKVDKIKNKEILIIRGY